MAASSGSQQPMTEDHLRKGESVSGLHAVVAGSVSGLVARSVTAPMDTIKIRRQLQLASELKYRGILHTFRTVVREEGVRALWKGNVPASAMYVLYGSLQFGTYAWLNAAAVPAGLPPQAHSLAVGALAGLVSSLLTYPLDVLRTRLVANRSAHFFSLRRQARVIWATEGPAGFFRGGAWAVAATTLTTGLIFGIYETCTIAADAYSLPWLATAASPAAGLVSKAAVFPLDTVRRRLQIVDAKDIPFFTRDPGAYGALRGSRFLTVAVHMVRVEGIASLYKGLSMALCKSTPTTVITLWVYQRCIRLLEPTQTSQLPA
ncbi:AaceriAAR036Wp [[Ashbya] aceris (nom. inval.)]|nr:AaceriAAR036Wp [[Ashbya] aceris (nom. inval.)]